MPCRPPHSQPASPRWSGRARRPPAREPGACAGAAALQRVGRGGSMSSFSAARQREVRCMSAHRRLQGSRRKHGSAVPPSLTGLAALGCQHALPGGALAPQLVHLQARPVHLQGCAKGDGERMRRGLGSTRWAERLWSRSACAAVRRVWPSRLLAQLLDAARQRADLGLAPLQRVHWGCGRGEGKCGGRRRWRQARAATGCNSRQQGGRQAAGLASM